MHLTLLKSLLALKEEYDSLIKGKESLLAMIEKVELPESVYNSNAIENSTLTLDETEKIILHHMIPANHSKREIFEATNLAKLTEYLSAKVTKQTALDEELICFIHNILLHDINDDIAGRFRRGEEYVRVGRHIAPAPQHVPVLIAKLLKMYNTEEAHPIEKIVFFHPEFERIHPFCDGNGRVGRALLNFQLKTHGFPPIIIQNREKQEYYRSLVEFEDDRTTKLFEHIIGRLLKESLHKRITYLKADEILPLANIAKTVSRSPQSIINSAKRQSIPAFRERGHWKIGKKAFRQIQSN